jgi:hypothetical protein
MNDTLIRLECAKLANAQAFQRGLTADETVELADKLSQFVLGQTVGGGSSIRETTPLNSLATLGSAA